MGKKMLHHVSNKMESDKLSEILGESASCPKIGHSLKHKYNIKDNMQLIMLKNVKLSNYLGRKPFSA